MDDIHTQKYMLKVLKKSLSAAAHSVSWKSFKQLNQLTKMKLSVLNGLVTIASYSLYSTNASCVPLFAASVLLSMSTQSLNQYIEIEYDRKMVRTCQRPLVQGLNPSYALGVGILCGTLGIAGMLQYNYLTAGLGAAIWMSYLGIYTRMKTQSELNTFVGSIIGSLPVYLGWAASGRSICMAEPFALFMYMIAWQHQHFYGIRWIYYDDYNRAGFKMQRQKPVAAAQTLLHTTLSIVLINYAMQYFQFSHCLLLNIPLTLGLYWWGIKPVMAFSKGQLTGKELKMSSYKHFTLVFCIFIFCSLLSRKRHDDIIISDRNSVRDTQGFQICL